MSGVGLPDGGSTALHVLTGGSLPSKVTINSFGTAHRIIICRINSLRYDQFDSSAKFEPDADSSPSTAALGGKFPPDAVGFSTRHTGCIGEPSCQVVAGAAWPDWLVSPRPAQHIVGGQAGKKAWRNPGHFWKTLLANMPSGLALTMK